MYTIKSSNYFETQGKIKTLRTAAIALILIIVASAVMIHVPTTKSLTPVTLSTHFNQFIGQNSQTLIIWTLTPNILSTDPAYAGLTSAWSTAKITFTRPDGTKDVVNGPITVEPAVPQGVAVARFTLFYTPNTQGNWVINLYWPGDSTYSAVNQTDPFYVGAQIAKRTTYAMLSMQPATVGIGQSLMINAWITPPPLTNYQAYFNYMFTFTRPDGTTFTVGPMNSESEGTIWFDIQFNQIGVYSIRFDFPGDYASQPSTVTRTIAVQQAPVTIGYPDTPLPTNEWSFPINVENRAWRDIAGEWLQSYYDASQDSCNPYTQAPRSAHILWELPAYNSIGGYVGSPHSIQTGGAVEGDVGDVGVFQSQVPSINTVMAGRGYYNALGNINCVDMHSGKTLWSVPGSFNVGATRATYGPVLYSFGSRFVVYNGMDGSMILNTTGMSMNFFTDPYVYTYSRSNAATGAGFLTKWDTTGTSTNFTTRIVWNQTNVLPYTTTAHCLIQGNLMISRHFLTEGVQNYGVSSSNTVIVDYLTAVNLTTGLMAWNVTTLNPSDPTTWIYRQGPAWGSGQGLVYFAALGDVNQARGYVAFNATTGKLAWWSQSSDYPWGNFWAYLPQASGYGMVIGLGYNGVYGFNATNGKIVWHFIDNNAYNEEPYTSNIAPDNSTYSSYTFGSIGPVVGGGIVFAPDSEHSPTLAYRGMGVNAIDIFTGKPLWRILGAYDNPTAIAYGTLLVSDSWNGYTYAFGKGDTTTSVSTSSKVLAKGDSMLLEGNVLDSSSAQNGTPAISDASQEAWMEYLHMQQPKPTNATGVLVSLSAMDGNGNITPIGQTISDTTGHYAIQWTPANQGVYTVTAAFGGSDSYYSSSAEASVLVTKPSTTTSSASPVPTSAPSSSAPTTATPVPPTTASPSQATIPPTSGIPMTTYIAITTAIVVIVILIAALLVLRKRKKQ